VTSDKQRTRFPIGKITAEAFRPGPGAYDRTVLKLSHVRFLALCALLALPGCPASRKSTEAPRVITLDGAVIAGVRERARAGDAALKPALEALRQRAEKALAEPVVEIASKPREFWARSGDPKDYISTSKFAWPDPHDPSKWVMIDGKPNAEAAKNFDGPKMKAMQERVTALAEGWYFLGDKRCAAAAAEQLRAWFLDPRTAMNPNMNFAQAIKPDENGKPWGIIDANRFPHLLDSAGLIADSGEWRAEDEASLREWFKQFNRWLVDSPLGQAERAAKNNHGTFYDLILASGAAYTGDDTTMRAVLEAVGPGRLDGQITSDGSTPEELKRAESAMYALWNLSGLTDLAAMAAKHGINVWHYPDAQNAKLKQAGEFLLPYALGTSSWTFGKQQMNQTGPLGFFRRIAPVYREPRFTEAVAVMAQSADPGRLAADVENLLRPWPAGEEPWMKP
jgi:hypothetical protein